MRKPNDYTGYTIHISKKGSVTLRRPSGRSVAWWSHHDPDYAASEMLDTYKGATLVDKRSPKKAA